MDQFQQRERREIGGERGKESQSKKETKGEDRCLGRIAVNTSL